MPATHTEKNVSSPVAAAEKNDRMMKEITRLILRRQTGQLSWAESARLQLLGKIVDWNVKSKAVLDECRSYQPDDLISKIEEEGFGVIASFQSCGFNCYICRQPSKFCFDLRFTRITSNNNLEFMIPSSRSHIPFFLFVCVFSGKKKERRHLTKSSFSTLSISLSLSLSRPPDQSAALPEWIYHYPEESSILWS